MVLEPLELQTRAMGLDDVEAVIAMMSADNRLAFEEWERPLLEGEIRSPAAGCNLVAIIGEDVVGALIGGVFATMATVSHVLVRGEFRDNRKLRVGSHLLREGLKIFTRRGATEVFCVVLPGNDGAYRFFSRREFGVRTTHVTLEQDLPASSLSANAFSNSYRIEPLRAADVGKVVQMLADCTEVPDRLCCPRVLSQNVCKGCSRSFVAWSGRKVVGVVLGGSFGVRGTVMPFVHPDHRCNGLGKALVAYAANSLHKAGVIRIQVLLDGSLLEAKSWLEAQGWSVQAGEQTMLRTLA